MTSHQTFLPPAVLERSRDRERRARQRRAKQIFGRDILPARFERRDALVVLLVVAGLGATLRYTHVLDRWFDRFNNDRPDQMQAAEALAGRG